VRKAFGRIVVALCDLVTELAMRVATPARPAAPRKPDIEVGVSSYSEIRAMVPLVFDYEPGSDPHAEEETRRIVAASRRADRAKETWRIVPHCEHSKPDMEAP
jgi:hypothetical protein